MSETDVHPSHFIRDIVLADQESGLHSGRVQTRFPPEPNGYLHIGHSKSICLNFGLAEEFGGQCNLRFDDTNPEKEETEYVEAIKADVRWLGFQWAKECYASDYFQQLYDWAEKLISDGKAFVCDLNAEETRAYRGTLTEPGRPSPFRERSVKENLDLFRHMRAGEFPDGTRTLRAKIDMASPNLNLRDPVLYRIKRAHHHRTGDAWPIYPSYDFTHGQSDSLEKVTHSICTLEFETHRPLYEWFIAQLDIFPSHQYEFARLNLNYTVMSKRKLLQLVKQGVVSSWDDPRMPTISGARRRGTPPLAFRRFCETIGVTKFNGMTDIALFEHTIRNTLNPIAPRRMAVLDPLKVTLTNYPEGKVEHITAINNPEDAAAGERQIPFGHTLYIDREDFLEDAPKKFFRLKPGGEVRLRNAYVMKCDEVVKDAAGNVIELKCTVDFATLGANPEGRKVKGVIHWVSAAHAVQAEVRLYDRLFTVEKPDGDKEHDFMEFINPDSLRTVTACLEPELALDAQKVRDQISANAQLPLREEGSGVDSAMRPMYSSDLRVQFERVGYFCLDEDSTAEKLVFNRTVALKDSWAKHK
ncbi:glutamine--tRNA ligase/YqeY domain fusion protein [Cerasicoccus arenae]|uniref:Glutamine--tRNA ligase n=1 Tax=Cerasicoccus arenae TaxID=424488 RepID=A0A8J3DEK8_9BACT|nr:glutamine--tRNA ligase/YqeY domain fusion protein [Cerasicoccus arenae]MBK1856923.1 glutamine--tRNA ligase/YqeY domain fusion protein [Cerasicoccus arenae]GHB89868.1 glutamine--tRNA ligase [Cerasicoccus arenae]